MVSDAEGELAILSENDVVACRKIIRDLTTKMGFGVTDVTRIVTAVSELARNVFVHGIKGYMRWKQYPKVGKIGIEIVFDDEGPGIPDLDQVMQPGFSTAGSMGMGLPGVTRLMDEFKIDSRVGIGTKVSIYKWARAK